MSVRIPLIALKLDEKKKIVSELHFIDETPKYGSSFSYSINERKVYYREGKYVYLPYWYVSNLTKVKSLNSKKAFCKIEKYSFLYTLRPHQKEIVEIALRHFKEHGTTTLNLFCSFGKTVVAYYLSCLFASKLSLSTMIVVPPNGLFLTMWLNSAKEAVDAKYIHVFKSGSDPPPKNTQIYIAMKGSLTSIPTSILQRIGHLVLDEAHLLCSQIAFNQILRISPRYITILTATWERTDGFHKGMEAICGPHKIKKISTKPFYVFKINTPFIPTNYKMTSRGKMWCDVQKKYDEMPDRVDGVIKLIMSNLSRKILVLTRHADHVERLEKILESKKVKVVSMYGKKKSYKDANVIVGTMSKLGVGFDEKNVCLNWDGVRISLLILDASTKKIEQYAGRSFRSETPVIFHLVDNFKNNKDHWGICGKWYIERNGVIIPHEWGTPLVLDEVLPEIIKQTCEWIRKGESLIITSDKDEIEKQEFFEELLALSL
uniref:A18-like helicase n=1 Tax=Pithovirus LCDPAC01 TaxID=2506600 RepID=A0A481YQA5_9VIRU|nr:MAG: A18-like helicase [Pithovirus LCDPAC01]